MRRNRAINGSGGGDKSKLVLATVVVGAVLLLTFWFGRKSLLTKLNGNGASRNLGDLEHEDDAQLAAESPAQLRARVRALQSDLRRTSQSRNALLAEVNEGKRTVELLRHEASSWRIKATTAVNSLSALQTLADETGFLPPNVSVRECVTIAEEAVVQARQNDCSPFDLPTAVIPRVIHVVWKDERLFPEAAVIDKEWRRREPCFRRNVVTDTQCRALAALFPGLLEHYDKLPVNVMRADVCRVLAVYFYGGIYMDIDVAWAKPLRDWFDVSQPIILGRETEDAVTAHVCNWFFAAMPAHPCIYRVLETIRERIRNMTLAEFAQSQHLIHFATGPKAFTDGVAGCAAPQLSRTQVRDTYIRHVYGSQAWSKSGVFASWVNERALIIGWKMGLREDVGEKFARYIADVPPTVNLGLAGREGAESTPQQKAVKVSQVATSSPSDLSPARIEWFNRAQHLFDRDLLTVFQTAPLLDSVSRLPMAAQSMPFVEVTLGEPTAARCVRVFARQDGDTESFRSIVIEAFDAANHLIATAGPFNNLVGVAAEPILNLTLPRGNSAVKVVRVTMVRNDTLIRFVPAFAIAELQLYPDETCTAPPFFLDATSAVFPAVFLNNTEEHIPEEVHNAEAMLKLAAMTSTVTRHCRDTRFIGRSEEALSGWAVCLDVFPGGARARSNASSDGEKCVVLTAGRHPGRFSFDDAFAERMCAVTITDPHFSVRATQRGPRITAIGRELVIAVGGGGEESGNTRVADTTDEGQTPRRTLQDLVRTASAAGGRRSPLTTPRVHLLRVDMEGREWRGGIDALVALAAAGQVDQVLIELHLYLRSGKVGEIGTYMAQLQRLLDAFELVAFWTNPHSSEEQAGSMRMLCCHRVTLVRKALLQEE